MANTIGKQTLVVVDEATVETKLADRASVVGVFAPAGTTETFELFLDGFPFIDFTCIAGEPVSYTFDCPRTGNILTYKKSSDTQKIYVYLK